MTITTTTTIALADICIPASRFRQTPGPDDLATMARSLAETKQLHPIGVTPDSTLVFGLRRLLAARDILHWTHILARILPLDQLHAELAEIDENLHRSSLTALEEGEHLARRSAILAALGQRAISGRPANGERDSPLFTTAQLAAQAGLSERVAQQRAQIAQKITEPVKERIRATPLADQPQELLQLARLPAELQPVVVERVLQGKSSRIAQAAAYVRIVAQRGSQESTCDIPPSADDATLLDAVGVRMLQADVLEALTDIPTANAALIIADPPYIDIAKSDWLDSFSDAKAYWTWLDLLLQEMQRVLAPNGSLYMFCGPAMAGQAEILVAAHFTVLNHLVWVKGDERGNGQHRKADTTTLRSFFPQTERIMFAEQRGADEPARTPDTALRAQTFESIRAYLAGEKARAGITEGQINDRLGNFMGRHYFQVSQWTLPTAEQYAQLQVIFNELGRQPAPPFADYHPPDSPWACHHDGETDAYLQADYAYLRADYTFLRTDYEELRADYARLRRPFHLLPDVPATDVWAFPTVAGYAGKHPAEKPLALLEHIIATSTNPRDLVVDVFAGSGVAGEAAVRLGRRYLGIERDPHWVGVAQARVARVCRAGDLRGLGMSLPPDSPIGES